MSHTVDETYDVYSEKTPKAAREYKCEACGEKIPDGHKYARVFIAFLGKPETVIRCLRCQAIHKELRGMDCYGETWPDERLSCGLDFEEEWGKPPHDELAALAFILPEELQ